MRQSHTQAAKRTISSTLAVLMVLYSLPPAIEPPQVFEGAHAPAQDEWMLLRQAAERLNLGAYVHEFGHNLYHLQEAIARSFDGVTRFAFTTPVASGDHQYIMEATSESTLKEPPEPTNSAESNYSDPEGVPIIDEAGRYGYYDFFGYHTGQAPAQGSAHTLRRPAIRKNEWGPGQTVEFSDSYFTAHKESNGYMLWTAHFINDLSQPAYPRAAIGTPTDSGLHKIIEHSGRGFLSGYLTDWRNWFDGENKFAGSIQSNYDEPKLQFDPDYNAANLGPRKGLQLALKWNPYWRHNLADLSRIQQNSNFAFVHRQYSLYYWETNPDVVARLNFAIKDRYTTDRDAHFLYEPDLDASNEIAPVKGFWVEIQPFRADAFGRRADAESTQIPPFPLGDKKQIEFALPWPHTGLNGQRKYTKFTFYRPYDRRSGPVETNVRGNDYGFLSAAEASVRPEEHSGFADYVCVGAFADADASDPLVAGAKAELAKQLWAKDPTVPTPSPGTTPRPEPSLPPGGGQLSREQVQAIIEAYAIELNAMPSSHRARVINALSGGSIAYDALQVLRDAKSNGVTTAIFDHSFFKTTDPTNNPGAEPNSTTIPPGMFFSTKAVDPVDVTSGAQYYDFYDLQIPGRGMRTDFLRAYNSDYRIDFSGRDIRPLGHGWTHTYNQFLHRFPDDHIAYYNEHGKSIIFTPDPGGFVAPAGVPLKLAQLGDGSYQLQDPNGTTLRFSGGLKRIATFKKFFYEDGVEPFGTKQPVDAGRLQTITDRNGNQFQLTYASGKLTQVTDPSGRHLSFTYVGDRVSRMTDVAGRTFEYHYEGDNLTEVIHPGNRRQAYAYQGHLMTSHSDLEADKAWRFAYSGEKVTQVMDPDGNRVEFSYAAGKTVQTTHEVNGRALVMEYQHANGDVTSRKDPEGTVYQYEFKDHRRTKETFNRGDRTITTTFVYDDQGNLTRFVDASGHETTIQYGANSSASQIKDPTGITAIRLDAKGNMLGATDPAGRSVTMGVDSRGQVTAVTDPGQHRTAIQRNGHGLVEHVDNPLGGWTSYTYNALGQVATASDPTGTRRYEYDGYGYMHALTDQLGRKTTFDNDANGNVTRITDPGGRVTTMAYNRRNQLVTLRNHAGGETRYAYTAMSQLWKVTDPNGQVTQMEHDGNGRLKRVVAPNQAAKAFKYDAAGNVTEVANELSETTRYAYDALNRITAVTDPEGQVTRMEHAWIGAVTRVINPLGHATQFKLNAVGQITDVIPPAPEGATHLVYTPDGNLARVERPKGQVSAYTYNAANQILTVTDPRKTVRYDYDSLGRLTGVTAPRGRTAGFRLDALGRLASATDALGNPTEYDYWPSGELKSVRRVNGAQTQFEYDGLGRISRVVAPEGRTSRFTYDANGNLIEQVSPSGGVTTYAFDALNRLTTTTDLAKGATWRYAYDLAGRVTSMTDPEGQSTSVRYDRLGRPMEVQAPMNARRAFEYDALGSVLKETDANGHSTSYAYNANNRLVRVTDALNHQTSYDYDALGNMTAIRRHADGAATQVIYNELNLPEEIVNALSHRTRMEYDEFGNRTATIDAKNRTTRYEYDALNRVVATIEPLGKTTRFAYDRVGNMERIVNALGANTRMVYDMADRLRFLYQPLGRTTEYRYNALDQVVLTRDANGNQATVDYDKTGRPVRAKNGLGHATDYFYDRLDRLTRRTDALGHSTQYRYDPLSRLTGVTDAMGHQTRYAYDPVGNMTAQTDARGRQWTFRHDELDRVTLERDPLGRSTQYTFSPVGTLAQLRDGNGRVTSYAYDRRDRLTGARTPEDMLSFTYDEVDNLTSYQNRHARVQNRYDDRDRLIEESNQTWGKTTRYGYDQLDRLTGLTTPMGRSVRYNYDELDQLRTLTDPEGNRTNYQYDLGGRLTTKDLPTGNRTRYAYDQADQTRSVVHQGRNGQGLQGYAYDYDRVGNRTQSRELDGASTRYSYDPLYRLAEVNYPLATILAERKGFLPDTASQPRDFNQAGTQTQATQTAAGSSGLPQLSASSSGLGTTTRKVLSVQSTDNQGNMGDPDKDKNPDANGNGWANGHGNDGTAGNNGNTGDPDKDKNPDANGNGHANGHRSPTPSPTSTPGSVPTFAPSPDPTAAPTPGPTATPYVPSTSSGGGEPYIPTWMRSPSPVPTATPTPAAQPTPQSPTQAPVAKPGNGNGPTKDQLPPGKQGNWGAHNQPYWAEAVASTRYTYDEVGNRTSEKSERGTTQFSYDEANQLKRKVTYGSRPTPAVGNAAHPHHADAVTYEYDGNGNRVAKTENKAGESKQLQTTRYDYNTLNQLTGIRHPEGRQATYAYDPLGRMIESHRPHLPGQRPVKAESSRFTYAGQDVIDEWWGDGSPRAEFYHGNGETVAKRLFDRNGHFEPGGVISPHENYLYLNHDALGSVSGMTDRLGQQVMRYRQDAFGSPTSGTLEPYNTQLLTEKGFDTTSGLYYFGSRWYDPGVGRFMNQDSYRGTAAEPMSQHRYAYVHNNPANLIDEWGYNAQWKPQPHNVALDGLVANVQGGGAMFMNYSQQLSGRVGARIGGMASGTYNGIVGAAQWVAADPWRAAGTAVVAAAITVGVVMTAPVSVPAIITGAGTLATNFVTSQAISLGVGAAVDAAALINPSLGEAASYVQRGVQIYQAATSLAGGIGSLSTFDMTSLASFSGISDASGRLSSCHRKDCLAWRREDYSPIWRLA